MDQHKRKHRITGKQKTRNQNTNIPQFKEIFQVIETYRVYQKNLPNDPSESNS